MVEVAVAIAIVGLLMALLLPAVQASRETARRIACSSQLRQISLAFANYDAGSGVFPGSAWTRQLRTFLEHPEGYDPVLVLACPSDRQHANGDRLTGRISYAMNDGLGDGYHNGMVPAGRPLSSRDVVDGVSMTVSFSERLSRPWFTPSVVDWDQHRALWNRVLQRVYVSTDDLEEFVNQCRDHAGRPQMSYYLGSQYDHVLPPNGNSCEVYPQGTFPIVGYRTAITASSPHPGGTHAAMVDGSIHFVSEQVDLEVWRAVGTRNGGEVIANDLF